MEGFICIWENNTNRRLVNCSESPRLFDVVIAGVGGRLVTLGCWRRLPCVRLRRAYGLAWQLKVEVRLQEYKQTIQSLSLLVLQTLRARVQKIIVLYNGFLSCLLTLSSLVIT